LKGILTIFALSLFALGCVGDDGREVIGSYAPTPDANTATSTDDEDAGSVGEAVENDGEAGADADSNLDTVRNAL